MTNDQPMTMSELTEQEADQLTSVASLLHPEQRSAQAGLMRAELDGYGEVAVIVAVAPEVDDPTMMGMSPIAVLLNREMFGKLTPCIRPDHTILDGVRIDPEGEVLANVDLVQQAMTGEDNGSGDWKGGPIG